MLLPGKLKLPIMSKKFTELRFEEWIEISLLNNGFSNSFIHNNENESRYDKDLCLVSETLSSFIKSTQETEYQKLYDQFVTNTDNHILKTLDKTISQRGIIDTLRKGIQTRGCSFDLVYFKPKSTMNKEHGELYSKNQFTVVRQLHYSKQNYNSIDMVLFLNGIPIITMELKNQLTGQNYKNSEYQYKHDRDPKEKFLSFKRCLVHFCIDTDVVTMTTKLNNGKTKFLPYNKGITNPVIEGNYRTEYLWNEILTPDSLLEIIENFVLISVESDKEWDEKKGRVIEIKFDVQIFPRYHQLDLLRKLNTTIVKEGVGNNYLIQNTTGSGKSYSIGWLSHLLTSLYQNETDTKRMFDTILVITDRKVLDQQLQGTVLKLEQTDGVVSPVEKDSKQLMEFLEKGKDIIITTVQKFPVISEVISQLKSKTFGVIIDEVHSSQSGETSKHLKKSLSKVENDEDEDVEVDYEDIIREEIQSRGKQPHISFFGFTGTPKEKTLELFGRKNSQGEFVPFHTYSMKQSIHEGFTLDVLQNYTTYKRYFKVYLTKDKIVTDEGQVMKELIDYVDSHPQTIKNKVTVILDHFVNKTSKTIGGRGRGMVVVRSRKHCVLFHNEMVRQMKERHLTYSCLVGYSGSINHYGVENTEITLNTGNGLKTHNIPDGLKDPRYRILIVSNKFQTGFDEPLLQSMYIDKKLGGVQCVQTLSRLNRTKTGKEDTFVLDFVNNTEDVVKSFQPYYTSTLLTEETEPDKLYNLVYEIEKYNLYTKYQLDEFCKEFYSKTVSDGNLNSMIDVVVNKYLTMGEENQTEFKSLTQSFIRLYSYISQISNFGEVHWEKTYIFLKLLNRKLPKGKETHIPILDSVDLDSLRVQLIGQSKLTLVDQVGELEPISTGVGGGMLEPPPPIPLSEIIEKINNIYGIELRDEDKLDLQNVSKRTETNDEMKKVMSGNNSEDVKKEFFTDLFKENMVDYTGERLDFYKKVMNDKVFQVLVDMIYSNYKKSFEKELI
jgi:type I restriction enzyme R subunit